MKVVLIVLGAIVMLVGILLPKTHRVSLTRTYVAPPGDVWLLVSEFENYESWRSGLKELMVIDEETWAEVDERGDKITFRKVDVDPQKRLVTKIIDEDLPFGGTWTLELEQLESGTKLTITEDGEIYHPVFRFFAHFVFGYEATAKKYLNDLEKHLNQER